MWSQTLAVCGKSLGKLLSFTLFFPVKLTCTCTQALQHYTQYTMYIFSSRPSLGELSHMYNLYQVARNFGLGTNNQTFPAKKKQIFTVPQNGLKKF